MPVQESTDHTIAPKSILRHRPIGEKTTTIPVAQRASRPHAREVGSDVPQWKRSTKNKEGQQWASPSHVRFSPAPGMKTPARVSRTPMPVSNPQRLKRTTAFQAHPLLFLGLGMLVMLTVWMLLNAAYGWVTTTLDDLHYGRPRTFQTDAWVGHNEQTGVPSHFIVLNLNRHLEIIEIAGSDPAHTHIYTGPQLSGPHDDVTPGTVRFVTPPGKKYPNMILLVGETQVSYLNAGATFVPQ